MIASAADIYALDRLRVFSTRDEWAAIVETLTSLITDQTVEVYIPPATREGQVQLLGASDALNRLVAGNQSPMLLAGFGYELEGLVLKDGKGPAAPSRMQEWFGRSEEEFTRFMAALPAVSPPPAPTSLIPHGWSEYRKVRASWPGWDEVVKWGPAVADVVLPAYFTSADLDQVRTAVAGRLAEARLFEPSFPWWRPDLDLRIMATVHLAITSTPAG
ncbi:MAG: hypothetical protein L6367_14010, partial [Cellulomonas sp.]|nr:hypothetical protein [Cellulomonas sp.]